METTTRMWTINCDYAREFAVWSNKKYPYYVSLVANPYHAQSMTYHFTAFDSEEFTWGYILDMLEDIYGKPTGSNILRIVSMTYQETCYGQPSQPVIKVVIAPPVALKHPEELQTLEDNRYGLTKLSIVFQIHELQNKLNTLETYIQRVL